VGTIKPIIEACNLSFSYVNYEEEEIAALKDVSLNVKKGEFLVVIGHNGSGKSTLAKHINALIKPDRGIILVKGMDTSDDELVWDIRQTAGMVFQNPDNQLVATIVEEDVAFGPENLGVPRSVVEKADEGTREAIMDFIKEFSSTDINLEYFDLYNQVMYILSSAEISSNLSRYDGIKFGYRASGYTNIDDLYIKTRSEGFGLDAKLTAIMGAMILSKDQYGPYYEKAMKIRRLIKESVKFDTYKVIVLPCRISDDPYENLALYSLAPLAGLPSVSFSYKGHGIQLVAGVKKENLLLSTWEVSMA
jgi:ABC-type cobalamin/Fe3+-siderophores transport system ATPase subunit